MTQLQYFFRITHDRDGYRARFYGNYGRELIWWTEAYSSRANAQNAVDIMRRNASTAPVA